MKICMCYKKQKRPKEIKIVTAKKRQKRITILKFVMFWMLLSWNDFALYVKELASGCTRTLETLES